MLRLEMDALHLTYIGYVILCNDGNMVNSFRNEVYN